MEEKIETKNGAINSKQNKHGGYESKDINNSFKCQWSKYTSKRPIVRVYQKTKIYKKPPLNIKIHID